MPLWFRNLLTQEPVLINGDGETSRDFCYVTNVVQANILAATTQNAQAINQVYNVACGQRTTLNELFTLIRTLTGV
jgi:UDP-N-acetylglucosamine 4-epimerase